MGIELGLSDSQPAVNRNRVFVTRLSIEQAMLASDTAPPVYSVTVEYRRYGVDAQGNRHYANEMNEVYIKDFLARAMSEAALGDMSMVQALQAIESAVAAIIADDLNTTASVI